MDAITIRECETFLAQFTGVGLFAGVNALMFLTVALCYKAFITIFTFVRTLATVNFQMVGKQSLRSENTAALIARKKSCRLFNNLVHNFHVLLAMQSICKRSVTHFTNKWLFARMHSHVCR